MRDKVLGIIRTSIPEPGRRNLVVAYINALERELDRAREKAITDDLTGIDNRRAFEIALKRMISRSLQIQVSASLHGKAKSIFTCITKGWEYPVSCVMTDIDHFKEVNDTFGHQTGDAALRFFSLYLAGKLTDTDALGRFGGEEFIVGLEGYNHIKAFDLIDNVRKGIQGRPVTEDLVIKFSAGISSSEHNPEIVMLYSKKIVTALLDYLKGKSIAKPLSEISRRLRKKEDQIEHWFSTIQEMGNEFIDKGCKCEMQDLLTHKRSDFACYIFEHRADLALYRAKETGRDKVCVWTPDGIIETIK